MGKSCCGKAAEGHGCGCGTKNAEYIFSTSHSIEADSEEEAWEKFSGADVYGDWFITDVKNAEEPAIEEPDWIPAGDGRAIGQQNFGINLSPLHAEGKSKCGCGCSIGKCQCPKGCKCGCGDHKADTVGSPSPTFNEDITGQDGPSANPTNETFEARNMNLAPSSKDVRKSRDRLNQMYGDVIADKYLVNQQTDSKTGKKQNKFYYVALVQKGNRFYPLATHGGIENNKSSDTIQFINVEGRKSNPEWHTTSASHGNKIMQDAVHEKKGDYHLMQLKRGKKRPAYKHYREVTMAEMAAETLAEIEGPTAEATTGGLHAPSSFAMTWEDGTGQSSASIPPNEIAWAENVQEAESKGMGLMDWGIAALALLAATKAVAWGLKRNPKNKETKEAKGCCGNKRADTIRKDSEYSVGQINPVVVEDQNDVYGAEELHSPQTAAKVSQPNWGPQVTYLQNQRSTQKMW